MKAKKIGLGGGCHWCTEGVFQSLIGINKVKQGWISGEDGNSSFSEAVIVEYDSNIISVRDLIEIHLYTHASTSQHSFRNKYRSAIYVFTQEQKEEVRSIISEVQSEFKKEIITQVLLFSDFKENREEFLNYLYTRENNAFCENYIHPKLTLLRNKFGDKLNESKLNTLKSKVLN